MAKSLDRVLQPDGSYRWEEVEHVTEAQQIATACTTPVVEPVKKEALEVQKETTADFEAMTKAQLETYGRTIGLELDKRNTKTELISELKTFIESK